MAFSKHFFDQFPPVSKEEWLQQIAKDLKGRPLEELDWQVDGDWKVPPFAHADDFAQAPVPLSGTPNQWEICEDVLVSDTAAANRQSLEALEGGAEGLRFHFEKSPAADAFDLLFEGIYPDYIGLHFAGPGMAENPGAIVGNLERLAKAKNIPTENLRGSLCYDPAASARITDWRYLADLAEFAKVKFPGFKLVTVGAYLDSYTKGKAAEALAVLLQQGNLYMQKLTERGLSAAEAAGAIQFSIAVGESYFLEIAKIRAFKLLWLNVLNGWGAPLQYPMVDTRFHRDVYTEALYTNMIRATTMSMSAVLGGADRLTVLPYDAGREAEAAYPPAFSRRMARNVQHLLKMEGFFVKIPDPAAGSYYIEQLTRQLAERAWAAFQTP